MDKQDEVAIGSQMKKIALDNYTWLQISEKYEKIINL